MELSVEGTFSLTKAEATALARYASTDTARSSLCGVWFEPQLMRAWATDGHRAVMARKLGGHWLGSAAAVIILREKLLDVARMCVPKGLVRVYAGNRQGADDGGTRTLGAGPVVGLQAVNPDGTVRMSTHCSIDPSAAPPAIDQVVRLPEKPCHPGAPYFGMNANYLAELALIAKAIDHPGITVYPPADPLAPLGIRASNQDTGTDTEWTAVIMPVRIAAPAIDVEAAVRWAADCVEAGHGAETARALLDAFPGTRSLPEIPAKRGRLRAV